MVPKVASNLLDLQGQTFHLVSLSWELDFEINLTLKGNYVIHFRPMAHFSQMGLEGSIKPNKSKLVLGTRTPPMPTGKSLSEALIFASTNPKYDGRLFIKL